MKIKNEELHTSVGSRSHGVAESGCRVSSVEKDSTRKEHEVTPLCVQLILVLNNEDQNPSRSLLNTMACP